MPVSEPSSASRAHWFALGLLLVACAAVRLLCLGCKPFWFDECFSVEVARIDWHNFFHLMWWREANMSLYYVLLRLWLRFGQSPTLIRGLSTLVAAATLPAVYWLARLLYNRRVALIAVALFTFNAYNIRYSQEARSYALLVLLATLSSAFLVAWLRQSTRRKWTGYVVFSILAVYAHFYALLLIVVHWLALRCRAERPPELRSAWIRIGVGVSPLLLFAAKTGAGPIKWIKRPGLRDVLSFYQNLAGGNSWVVSLIFVALCAAAIFPFKKRLWSHSESWEVWRSQFLLIWLTFPVALTVLLSFARPVFLARYMIFCLPALLILVAAGIASLRPTWLRAGTVCAVLILSARTVPFVYTHDFDNERDASVAAANFILDHAVAGDAILFHIAETRIPYEFVRDQRTGANIASPKVHPIGPDILFPHHREELDYRDFTGKPGADFLRMVAPGHARVWVMLMNNGTADSPDPTTVMLTDIMPRMFAKVQRWQFAKVEVRVYSRE